MNSLPLLALQVQEIKSALRELQSLACNIPSLFVPFVEEWNARNMQEACVISIE